MPGVPGVVDEQPGQDAENGVGVATKADAVEDAVDAERETTATAAARAAIIVLEWRIFLCRLFAEAVCAPIV